MSAERYLSVLNKINREFEPMWTSFKKLQNINIFIQPQNENFLVIIALKSLFFSFSLNNVKLNLKNIKFDGFDLIFKIFRYNLFFTDFENSCFYWKSGCCNLDKFKEYGVCLSIGNRVFDTKQRRDFITISQNSEQSAVLIDSCEFLNINFLESEVKFYIGNFITDYSTASSIIVNNSLLSNISYFDSFIRNDLNVNTGSNHWLYWRNNNCYNLTGFKEASSKNFSIWNFHFVDIFNSTMLNTNKLLFSNIYKFNMSDCRIIDQMLSLTEESYFSISSISLVINGVVLNGSYSNNRLFNLTGNIQIRNLTLGEIQLFNVGIFFISGNVVNAVEIEDLSIELNKIEYMQQESLTNNQYGQQQFLVVEFFRTVRMKRVKIINNSNKNIFGIWMYSIAQYLICTEIFLNLNDSPKSSLWFKINAVPKIYLQKSKLIRSP